MLPAIPEFIQSLHQDIATLRRDIHAHPEIAFEETRTAAIVAQRLSALGLEVHTGIGKTGVVGVLRCGHSARAIGLRADMDALPMQEANDFEHRSQHPNRMHACGHDGHIAMLIGAATALAKAGSFDGTVYFIFQPAEEGEGGAASMIADGLFERFLMDGVYGLHNWPGLPVGQMAVHAGPVMASADRFEITVTGRGAHAAMPHQGVDSIVVATQLVQSLQTVVSRNVNPLDSAVLSVTQFHAGDAYNIIPEKAELAGTVRAFRTVIQDQVETAIGRLCHGIAETYDARIDFRYHRGYPPTINDAQATELCRRVAASVLGEAQVRHDLPPTMGAEDFAHMLLIRPGAYVWLGGGPGQGGCTLHNPRFDFNDEIIPYGIAYWVKLVETLLPKSE